MRKTTTITIDAQGRDLGKQYFLTELPATQAEKWAIRAFLGLAKSGVEIPQEIRDMGMAGIGVVGFRMLAGMDWAYLEPLLDEMFTCVQMIPDPNKPLPRRLVENDIEEIATRMRLRIEVFKLHVDFSEAGALLNSASPPAQ